MPSSSSAPSGCQHALSVRGLTVLRQRRQVLEDVSLSAQPGAVTAVLGEAGCGKTSLLAAIAGLLKPARGAVLVGGVDVTRARPGKRGIGFLPPGSTLGRRGTVSAALAAVADRALAPALLEILAMPGGATLAEASLAEASHGQHFAALAAARLAPSGGGSASILLVDEAGTGLSRGAGDALLDWLRAEAASGRTMLLATRDARLALAADHLILLHEGRMHQAGAPATVHAEPFDAIAAALTGPANILRGTLRQKLPGGFVWVAAGQRFTQADNPAQPAPGLGMPLALCLRPGDVTFDAAAPNGVPATVERLICRGDGAEILCDTPLGPIRAACAGTPRLRAGMKVTLGWATDAACVVSR